MHSPLACLVGPTASGKSQVALVLAQRFGAEIVSLDSMQVYRGMDVGTAKASREERALVPHHMLDRVLPSELYDVSRYLADALPVLGDIAQRGRRALVVGGTGLYLKSLLAGLFEGPRVDRALRAAIEARAKSAGNAELHRELALVDPPSAARIHVNDTKRLVRALEVFEQTGRTITEWQKQWASGATQPASIAGLEVDVADLDRRIAARTVQMIRSGWPEEAVAIRERTGFSRSSIQALGYREVLDLADGRVDFETCAQRVSLRTRQFARRQRTWYRKFANATWFPPVDAGRNEASAVEALAERFAAAFGWT